MTPETRSNLDLRQQTRKSMHFEFDGSGGQALENQNRSAPEQVKNRHCSFSSKTDFNSISQNPFIIYFIALRYLLHFPRGLGHKGEYCYGANRFLWTSRIRQVGRFASFLRCCHEHQDPYGRMYYFDFVMATLILDFIPYPCSISHLFLTRD